MEKIPTLCLLDFHQPFIVETDAYDVIVGVVLSLANHPISFFAKKKSVLASKQHHLMSEKYMHFLQKQLRSGVNIY